MPERKILSTWKEIATYVSRGVRTVQRWEAEFSMPVHRTGEDRGSVFAFADELDAWLERATMRARPYVRPTIIVLDQPLPNAISNRKLTLEIAKFNVLTAFTSAEMLATAERFHADGFIVDSVMIERQPCELCDELKRMHPKKPVILIGEGDGISADHVLAINDPAALLELTKKVFGEPKVAIIDESVAVPPLA
jgi:CheY-like chemotaxis protein